MLPHLLLLSSIVAVHAYPWAVGNEVGSDPVIEIVTSTVVQDVQAKPSDPPQPSDPSQPSDPPQPELPIAIAQTDTKDDDEGTGDQPQTKECPAGWQAITFQNDSGEKIALNAVNWQIDNCGSIPKGGRCTTCQPPHTDAGNMAIGTQFPIDSAGRTTRYVTQVEGNNVDPRNPWINVSIIPGYTFPVKCTSSQGRTTGFDHPLCSSPNCAAQCNKDAGFTRDGGWWNSATRSCESPKGQNPQHSTEPYGGNWESDMPFFDRVDGEAYWFPFQGVDGHGLNGVMTGEDFLSTTCVVYPSHG